MALTAFWQEDRIYLMLSVLFDEEDSWRWWTKEREIERKRVQDRLLKRCQIRRGKHSWGEVMNEFCPKSGFSAIAITYRTQPNDAPDGASANRRS
jgi:hypothetical protein